MKHVESSDFKAKCSDLIDQVVRTGDELAITEDGEPVAKLSPYGRKPGTLAGLHRHSIRIVGDIVSPAYSSDETDQ